MNKNTKVVASKEINVSDIAKLIASMSEAERNALGLTLKESDVKITAKKSADKTYVAARYNLVDSSPNAKKQRVKGTIEYLTEKQLDNTLGTWVRKDADTLIPKYKADIMEQKHKFSLKHFEIVGITHTKDISTLATTFN